MDLLDNIIGEMDTKGKPPNKPADQRRPTTTETPGSTGTSVWSRNRPETSSSRVGAPQVVTKKEEQGTPTPSAGSNSLTPKFSRIPKRPRPEELEQSAKRHASSGPVELISFQPFGKVPVQLNMFEIDISKMDSKIHRVLFKVFLIQRDGSEFELNDGAHAFGGDVNRQTSRRAQWILFKKYLEQNPQYFNGSTNSAIAAYDCADTFYVGDSNYSGGIEEHTCLMEENMFSKEDWIVVTRLSRRLNPKFRIRIKSIGVVYTQGPEALTVENRPELTRVVETVTSQSLNNGDFLLYNTGVYPIHHNVLSEPDNVTEIKGGFTKAIKVLETDGKPDVRMTLDVACSAFFKTSSILTFITSKYSELTGDLVHGDGGYGRNRGGGHSEGRGYDNRGNRGGYNDRRGHHERGESNRDYRDNRSDRSGGNRLDEVDESTMRNFMERLDAGRVTRNQLQNIGQSLKGLVVEAKHLESVGANRSITIDGFHDSNADDMKFDWKDGETSKSVSITDYFLQRYCYRLRYPKLPLITTGKRRKGTEFFPPELLFILPGQRLTQSKTSVTVQSHMTGKNSSLPQQHVSQHQRILQHDLNMRNNEFMNKFKIYLRSSEPTRALAKLLAPPIIKFHQKQYQPDPSSVRFNTSSKFVKPAVIRTFTILNSDGNFNRIDAFKNSLANHCKDQGIRVEENPKNWTVFEVHQDDVQRVKRIMEQCYNEKVSIVLAICAEKRPDLHDVLKYYEERIGQQTMQICSETANKLMMDGNRQTLENIMRKLNVKCGGTNFYIDVPVSIRGVAICGKPEEMRRKLFAKTQFVGLEMSHTGARTQFDIQTCIYEGDPTVVGISYSLGNSTQLAGFHNYQATRETKIQNLDKLFPKVFEAYRKDKGSLPETIVIYRTGASESETPRLMEELAEIRKSFAVVPGYNPKLVVILAQRHSHARVFPERIDGRNAKEQNVQSGTAIDNVQSYSGATEFVLVSQSPLIGTVRPTRYAVVCNTANWNKNEILNVTYMLAFGHQVSYQPPSVPDVLYAAANLAKRGHNNYKTHARIEAIQDRISDLFHLKELDATVANPDDFLDLIIGDISTSLNRMTIQGRNFWA